MAELSFYREWLCPPFLPQILKMLKNITVKILDKIVQFTIAYKADDETGLPSEVEYDKLINHIFKILAQLTALPNVFFAGHFYL